MTERRAIPVIGNDQIDRWVSGPGDFRAEFGTDQDFRPDIQSDDDHGGAASPNQIMQRQLLSGDLTRRLDGTVKEQNVAVRHRCGRDLNLAMKQAANFVTVFRDNLIRPWAGQVQESEFRMEFPDDESCRGTLFGGGALRKLFQRPDRIYRWSHQKQRRFERVIMMAKRSARRRCTVQSDMVNSAFGTGFARFAKRRECRRPRRFAAATTSRDPPPG